jgi:hypothetical protein
LTLTNNSTDDLAGLVGAHVSVLFCIGDRRSTVQGLLVQATPTTLTLRSLASRTRGRETLLMRQHVIAVQRVAQEVAEPA